MCENLAVLHQIAAGLLRDKSPPLVCVYVPCAFTAEGNTAAHRKMVQVVDAHRRWLLSLVPTWLFTLVKLVFLFSLIPPCAFVCSVFVCLLVFVAFQALFVFVTDLFKTCRAYEEPNLFFLRQHFYWSIVCVNKIRVKTIRIGMNCVRDDGSGRKTSL